MDKETKYESWDEPNVGRPLKFKTPEDLQKGINEFFDECDEKNIPYTIEGICLKLGTWRSALYKYEHHSPEFRNIIKNAKERVSTHMIQNGLNRGYSEGMVKFLLNCNHNYQESINVNFTKKEYDITEMSEEEHLKMLEDMKKRKK